MFSAASDSVMLCATVNAVTIDRELADRAAEQQQPDEEQQVVRADQDVMDSRRHEPADTTAGRPCRFRRSIRSALYCGRGWPASACRLRR